MQWFRTRPSSSRTRSATTHNAGKFNFPNVPLNPYHVAVTAKGFANSSVDAEVRSSVPVSLNVSLQIGVSAENITVESEAGDLLENDPTFHTDVDRSLFEKLPLESSSSELSSLVTLATPGVAADSNGLFHGLGDHASNSFSLDGQPITDQQSKVFSTRHGGLFDPDAFPFLEGRPWESKRAATALIEPPLVSDGILFRILQDLLYLEGERISYRALDVEQIGSVYEAMMGFAVEIAHGISIGLGSDHLVVNLEDLLTILMVG